MNRQNYYQKIYQQQLNNKFCIFIDNTNNKKVCNALCFGPFCSKHILFLQRSQFVKKEVIKPTVASNDDTTDYLFVDDN